MILQERRVKNPPGRNQSGFMSTKTIIVAGSVVISALAGTAAYASFSSQTIIPQSLSSEMSAFCVKAEWIDEPNINAQRGYCGTNPPDVVVPPDDTDPSAVLATYTCGPAEIKITQKMQDHSDSNKALKDAGKSNEMIPYPAGGWNIIFDTSSLGVPGVAFTLNGAFAMGNFHNTSGYGLMMGDHDNCQAIKIKNGKNNSTNGPAFINVTAGFVEEESYYIDGKRHRVDGPAVTNYYPNGAKSTERWYIDGNIHRVDGPAEISYRFENGRIEQEAWLINGKLHRVGGPATTSYRMDGSVANERWYFEGEQRSPF